MSILKKIWQTILAQHWGPTTVTTVVTTAVGVVVGGIIAITDPATLSFATYMQDIAILSGGNGLVAVGRGLHLSGVARMIESIPLTANYIGAASASVSHDGPFPISDAEELQNPAPLA